MMAGRDFLWTVEIFIIFSLSEWFKRCYVKPCTTRRIIKDKLEKNKQQHKNKTQVTYENNQNIKKREIKGVAPRNIEILDVI